MLKKLLSVSAGLLFTLTVFAASVQWADHHPDRYIVKKGDTLWSISARFLKQPWLWPEIWQDNPQVRNPHLIYPGDELVLSNGHVGQGPGSIGPHARETSLGDAIPPIPLSALKQWLKSTRIIDELIMSMKKQLGCEVYRQTPDARDGRPAMMWRHGPNEFTLQGNVRFLGYEMLNFGTVEVTRSADVSSALVTYSDFEVRPGDYVLPIDEQPYDAEYVPHSPKQTPDNMRVIAFSDALNAVGPLQVVALSRGADDGVDNGTTFSIYHPGEEALDRTDYTEGSMKKFFHPGDASVTLPPEFIGHVMIFRTFKRVSYGLVMDAVKPVHAGDFLHDPNKTP